MCCDRLEKCQAQLGIIHLSFVERLSSFGGYFVPSACIEYIWCPLLGGLFAFECPLSDVCIATSCIQCMQIRVSPPSLHAVSYILTIVTPLFFKLQEKLYYCKGGNIATTIATYTIVITIEN